MSLVGGPVLIVDDDAAVRASLKFALELEGLEVRLYESAPQLLAEKALPRHGCIVIDYSMPGMSGLELMEALRLRQVSLPAILISGKVSDDLRRQAGRHGFLQVLEKPLEGSQLLDGIRTALAAS
ncbi:response regulator transcription factor [Chelatococcus composti]|jgi:two-component system response regulator FixJ|uniref:FixJ family two-component response regulator n=1 Tax=Chelatococcus composti TaxID=1743235 RepID=A0A841KAD9_9HYPH|nr:response regulator [Chelatococcus composti]MBB6168412.1 FixJ family two-component response regulator [Chelatococcus composti]MBS7736508.1 response regulator [Chelatococcus composti]PZN41768.1 MAG: response regulator [Pseudomonadota bacterium]GGG39847.1 response regulator [Chelatococcus composti]